MTFTTAQHTAITQTGNLVVTAGAGSGKTRVLVERYVRLLSEAFGQHGSALGAVDTILAITFTEKAAREMRDRVRQELEHRVQTSHAAERWQWEELRAAAEAARIGTIHSFCVTLLRAHPAETGLDPQVAVLDEVEAGVLLAESVDDALSQVLRRDQADPVREALLTALEEYGPSELRALLGELVRRGGPIRVALAALPPTVEALQAHWQAHLAAAQASVRRDLLASDTWQQARQTVLALAPTAPASDRIGGQVVAIAAWLAAFDPAAPDFVPLTSIDLRGGSKKTWSSADDLAAAKVALKTLRDSYRDAAAMLDLAPDADLEARAARTALALQALYIEAANVYAQRKQQVDVLDFDDLERCARQLLEQHQAVRERWQAEIDTVLVDEFQDTNDDQRAIVYGLVGIGDREQGTGNGQPSVLTTQHSLFVVGDGKQSIYRFRGADVSVFRRVAEELTAGGGQHVALDTSFRTHPPLVAWINQVTEAVFARPGALQSFEFPFEPLHAHRAGPPHSQCVELHLVARQPDAASRRAAEAHALAARIHELVETGEPIVHDGKGWRGPHYGDVALLFQASTAFEIYEQALSDHGIPYLTTAGRGYYGRKEVQDLIHLLRVLADPSDELALVGVLRSPLFALDDATILRLRLADKHSLWRALMGEAEIGNREQGTGNREQGTEDRGQEEAETDSTQRSALRSPLSALRPPPAALHFAREVLRDLHALQGNVTVVELLRITLERTGYLATVSGLPDGERRRVNIEKLVAAARLSGTRGLRVFGEYLETLLAAEVREGEAPLEAEGSVRIMTVHRSKGLEFPVVVLPDLGRGLLPVRATWLADPAYGLAMHLRDTMGELQKPIAYQLGAQREQQMDQAERERLLYVALTRARDYLLLGGSVADKSGSDWLSRIAAALGQPWEDGGPPTGEHGALRVVRHD